MQNLDFWGCSSHFNYGVGEAAFHCLYSVIEYNILHIVMLAIDVVMMAA